MVEVILPNASSASADGVCVRVKTGLHATSLLQPEKGAARHQDISKASRRAGRISWRESKQREEARRSPAKMGQCAHQISDARPANRASSTAPSRRADIAESLDAGGLQGRAQPRSSSIGRSRPKADTACE